MVQYYLKNGRLSTRESNQPSEYTGQIQILTTTEYAHQYDSTPQHHMLRNSLAHIHNCKADVMGNFITGTFSIPSHEEAVEKKHHFGFYLQDSELIFIDDHAFVISILNQLIEFPMSSDAAISHVLFAFMEYLIKDDMFFIQHYEETLATLEEALLEKSSSTFNRRILEARKKLAALGAYYEQLEDMGEDLQQGLFTQDHQKSGRLFGLFANRAGRLHSDIRMLKEYTMQLREMHQTQVDIRQNQIMKLLTVVTTIFMPLTLITGWYGMNFTKMPELASPYGYVIICIISLMVVAVEFWLFYTKKWFD